MTARLAHAARGPVAFEDLVGETREHHEGRWQPNWPEGTKRWRLGTDEATGGSTSLLWFPAGYERVEEVDRHRAGQAPRFEYHSCHEEIICVEGDYAFGERPWYGFSAPSYLNHPPYWLHPAHQRSEGGALLLVKNSHPVDFGFCDIPDGWDGDESYLPDADPGTAAAAVTTLALDEVELGPVEEDGRVLQGVRGARLWRDPETGWDTWLVEAVAGAEAPAGGPGAAADAVGEEWFVLEGAVDLDDAVLRRHGYLCDPVRARPVGWAAHDDGVRALRWTRGGVLSPGR